MIRAALPLAVVLLLAGCARSEDANLMPADTNGSTRIAEQVRHERVDEGPALGAWRDTIQDTQRALEFGPQGAPPVFSLSCDARRSLLLQRHGVQPTGDLPVMLVSVGSETRQLAVTADPGPIPMLRATLSPGDPLAASLSHASGPITIRIGETPPLILPPSDQIGAYVAQCGNGTLAAATSAAAPAGNVAAPADTGSVAASQNATGR
ncbi:MAG: hypothetical protein JO276_16715 [Sphingomonadaceae bacterium]|nr:hypothetical protein [Sphingomonadaceae bacterium]